MKTAEIQVALAERFKAPEWAFLTEVRDGTGAASTRSADAVAMSLWPSRGLHLHGFEVKASRGDWLTEKKNPAKADAIAKYCDFWWLVIGDEKIVADYELPPTWGLMTPKGDKLTIKAPALQLTPEPLPRKMLAAIMRKIEGGQPTDEKLQAMLGREYQRGKENGKLELESFGGTAQKLKELEIAVSEFESKSGIRINNWNAGRVGSTLDLLMRSGSQSDQLKSTETELSRLLTTSQLITASIQRHLKASQVHEVSEYII